ncbi:probable amino-acid racemase [Tanacetum coccineum]
MKKTQLPAGATSGQGNEPWLAMAAGLPRLSSTVMPVTAGRHGTCQGAWSKSLEAKLKPIEAGSPVRIGVLSTNAILNAGFYQDKLQKRSGILQGFEVILPDKATMEHTIIPSTEAKSQKDIEGAQNLLRIAIHVVLPLRAVNTIILASDDLDICHIE